MVHVSPQNNTSATSKTNVCVCVCIPYSRKHVITLPHIVGSQHGMLLLLPPSLH